MNLINEIMIILIIIIINILTLHTYYENNRKEPYENNNKEPNENFNNKKPFEKLNNTDYLNKKNTTNINYPWSKYPWLKEQNNYQNNNSIWNDGTDVRYRKLPLYIYINDWYDTY
jgi:hypothetical protein